MAETLELVETTIFFSSTMKEGCAAKHMNPAYSGD